MTDRLYNNKSIFCSDNEDRLTEGPTIVPVLDPPLLARMKYPAGRRVDAVPGGPPVNP